MIAAVLAAGAAVAVLASCTPLLGRASDGTTPVSAQLQPVGAQRAAPGAQRAQDAPARPTHGTSAPTTAHAQKVIVSLRRSTPGCASGTTSVFQTAITTGMSGQWTSTPTGNYMIQGRNRNTVLTLNTGATYRGEVLDPVRRAAVRVPRLVLAAFPVRQREVQDARVARLRPHAAEGDAVPLPLVRAAHARPHREGLTLDRLWTRRRQGRSRSRESPCALVGVVGSRVTESDPDDEQGELGSSDIG